MKVSVIIVAYNSDEVIFDCLDSIDIFNNLERELEVIVVDNSPSNSIFEHLSSYRNKSFCFKYIHNPSNGGFGQGNNIGIDASIGEYLLILNPDTILVEPIFDDLISTMSNEAISLSGFRLVDKEGNDNDSIGLLPQLNYIYIPRKILNFFVINLNIFTSFVYPWGASLVIRRSDFIKYGKFDENIFLCNEEPDLALRIKNRNTKIINKKIIHLEGHTTTVPEYRFKAWLASTEYYFEKHHLNYRRFLYLFLIRNYSKKILKFLVNNNNDKERAVHLFLMEEIQRVENKK